MFLFDVGRKLPSPASSSTCAAALAAFGGRTQLSCAGVFCRRSLGAEQRSLSAERASFSGVACHATVPLLSEITPSPAIRPGVAFVVAGRML